MSEKRKKFGQFLARLRLDAHMSQRDLADELCRLSGTQSLTRNEVSRWERGARTPDTWLPFIADALNVPLGELKRAAFPVRRTTRCEDDAQVNGLAELRLEDPPQVVPLSRVGRRVGMETVEHLARRAHGLRLADDVLAGGDLLRPAYRELNSAVRLYRDGCYTEWVGRRLLTVIGELAQITGWIASDAGKHAEAARIYHVGLSAARGAADPTLVGNVLGSLAYQVTNVGDPREGVAMARAAVEHSCGTAPPKAAALYWDRLAWAHVQAKETQPALFALGQAAEAMARCEPGDEEPEYLYWMDHKELQIMEARAYTELRRPLRAVPILSEVLTRYDATHARELALYLSWLAIAYADANEPEKAASVAARMLELGADVPSERTAARFRVVLHRLDEYRDVPEVRALLDEYEGVLRPTTADESWADCCELWEESNPA